jgi:hypothetical protein
MSLGGGYLPSRQHYRAKIDLANPQTLMDLAHEDQVIVVVLKEKENYITIPAKEASVLPATLGRPPM